MEDNFVTLGFDDSSLGIEKYLNTVKPSADIAKPTVNFGTTKLDELPLTMAYIPMQTLNEKYNQETALKNGTLFPELDKPFLGRRI